MGKRYKNVKKRIPFRRKRLLSITLGQLRQLYELNYLSHKGREFYIDMLESVEEKEAS